MKLMTLSSPFTQESPIISIVSVKNVPVAKSVALGHRNGEREEEDAQAQWNPKDGSKLLAATQKMEGLMLGGDRAI